MIINNEEFGYVHINTSKSESEMTDDEIQEIYDSLRKLRNEQDKINENHHKVMESKITDRTRM